MRRSIDMRLSSGRRICRPQGAWAGWLVRLAAAAMVAAAAMPGGAWAAEGTEAAKPFRLCADPDNLPFSSSNASKPGIYVELGQEIARSLGREFEPVWSLSYFGKRTVRTTLLAGQCDAFIGLPAGEGFMGPQLIFSKPFMTVGYALAVPPMSKSPGSTTSRASASPSSSRRRRRAWWPPATTSAASRSSTPRTRCRRSPGTRSQPRSSGDRLQAT